MINCQIRFRLFQLQLLDVKFLFSEKIYLCRQTRTAVMDVRLYFRLSNSTGKMITCSMDNQKTF